MSGVAGDWESWTLEAGEGDIFYLKSFSGAYLGMETYVCWIWSGYWWYRGTCYNVVLKPWTLSDEEFEIRPNTNSALGPTNGLMIYNRRFGRYLSARGTAGADVTGMPIGPWEVFIPELVA